MPMQWSYSGSKQFTRCQRSWYFRNSVVNKQPNAKNPLRREAFLLSQLQSTAAWRGSLVDTVIEQEIILPLSRKATISEQRTLRYAEDLFDRQLRFAENLWDWWKEGTTKSEVGEEFAALVVLYEGKKIPEDELEQAWKDVEFAIQNLFANEEIIVALEQADQLFAQRTLYLKDDDFTVVAKPDVIAFYEDHPPLIIDWKVHQSGLKDYWLQLACYALALAQGKPHRDFMIEQNQYQPTEIDCVEVQLLTNQTRSYRLDDADVDAVENYIFSSAMKMLAALGDKGNAVLRPFEFASARNPVQCDYCPFKTMCWEERIWKS